MSGRQPTSQLLALPQAHGGPWFRASLKSAPEDFRVIEDLGFELDGAGEHLFIQVRKRDLNTQDVLERLQRRLDLKPTDIGVAGLKDRRAVADQWISLRGVTDAAARQAVAALFGDRTGGERAPEGLAARMAELHAEPAVGQPGDGPDEPAPLTLLRSVRHGRKLRRGAHRANRFEIILRDVVGRAEAGAPGAPQAPDREPFSASTASAYWREALDAQVDQLRQFGFPNYFGAQRFGIGGRNLDAALRYFAEGGRQRMARQRRGLLLSAARSALFNQVCAARVRDGSWLTPLPGEPLVLAGTQSYFIDERLRTSATVDGECASPGHDSHADAITRVLQGDVHTSGPLWGAGEPVAAAACLAFEQAVLADHSLSCDGLVAAGLEMHRRPLRCLPGSLALDTLRDGSLRLSVELPKGVFATSLLAELMVETEGGSSKR